MGQAPDKNVFICKKSSISFIYFSYCKIILLNDYIIFQNKDFHKTIDELRQWLDQIEERFHLVGDLDVTEEARILRKKYYRIRVSFLTTNSYDIPTK